MVKLASKFKRISTFREDFSIKLCFTSIQLYLLQSCGKSYKIGEDQDSNRNLDGFIDTYQPPDWSYNEPTNDDPFKNVLKSNYVDPYWVDALVMDAWETHVQMNMADNNSVMYFAFPENNSGHSNSIISGWTPASEDVKQASREIFEKINDVLEVQFVENSSVTGTNVVAIAQSFQEKTSGFGYFPNYFYEIGSDIFISTTYSKPEFISTNITNYQYEVLVHEIGHAIGLKHPFEADGSNTVILTEAEDTTELTAMSYTDFENSFNGTVRDLDWLALSKLYGVNDNYNSANNTYNFSEDSSTFILDGSGIDIIDASSFETDVNIDLRPGAQSFVGSKSEFISAKLQLTISHDTIIENVITGSGNDHIMGNSSENYISTNSGDDMIYLGAGDDVVHSGSGVDFIDCSEEKSFTDTIIFKQADLSENFDTVYGFEQGSGGDVLDISDLISETLSLLPVILYNAIPQGFISDHILRVVGPDLDTVSYIKDAFSSDGLFRNIELSNDKYVFMISSETLDTGENQNLFCIKESNGLFDVEHVSLFVGNSLDIDIWSINNFRTSDTDILV